MAAGRIITPAYMPALDSDGEPISGALLYTYANNTTTPKATYTDAALSVPHENPVVADASGVFPSIFADSAQLFSVTVTDAADAPLASYDNVSPSTVLATEAADDRYSRPETTSVTYYVRSTGDDGNGGLSSSDAFLTPAAAWTALQAVASRVKRDYVLDIGAGTFDWSGWTPDTKKLVGCKVTVQGAGKASTTLRGSSDGTRANDLLSASGHCQITVKALKVQSYSTAFAATQSARVTVDGVNSINTTVVASAAYGGFIDVTSAAFDWDGRDLSSAIISGSTALQVLIAASLDATQTSSYLGKIHHFERGVVVDEASSGHLDYLWIEDCTTAALNIKRGAGAANTKQMRLYRNAVGVLAENSDWFNNSIAFGTGADANSADTRLLGDSPELVFLTTTTQARSARILERTNVTAHTGTTTTTTLYTTPTFPTWTVGETGQSLVTKVSIGVTSTLTADCTISIAVYDGTSPLTLASILLPAGFGDGEIDAVVHYTGPSSQRARLTAVSSTATRCDVASGTKALEGLAHSVRINAALGNSADTLTFFMVSAETTLAG